jgi:hypothetical protein
MNRPGCSPVPLLQRPLHRWLLGLALLCLGAAATAQQDPPGRVARLTLQQGSVSFAPAGDERWYDAQPNRPLTTGDRLWTDRAARAEVHIGSAALRMDGQSHVEFSELDDDTVRLTANQGELQLRVRDDLAGQRFEIDTGNLAVVIDAPGEYRISANPDADSTWIAVASGRATLYGENGESQRLDARQQLTVSGRSLQTGGGAPPPNASFDAWVAERNRLEDQSVSARYVSREVVGYQQLDAYGDWQNDPGHGAVWFPRSVDADWAPYRDGQWVNIAPWGLTWVDAAPWGFAPFHYGRWTRVGPRWGWVPGRSTARPVYSPALVGFVDGRSDVGWFPLAPGEAWRPGYRASPNYLDRVNRMAASRDRQAELRSGLYANQQMPGAVSVLPAERFGRGAFGRRDLVRQPDDRFMRGPVVPMPGVPLTNFGTGFGRPAAVAPPSQPMQREQQERRFEQARRARQMQQAQQLQVQQQQPFPQQQQRQQMEWQRDQGRQQQDWQQRQQLQQQQQQQQQQQVQVQRQQQQQARQQQEMQQRALQAQQQQAQAQQQVLQQQQRAAQQQALAQQQMQRQQQQAQQRAVQAQQQLQAQQQAQQNAMRQAQEAQVRAMQQQRGFNAPGVQPPQPQPAAPGRSSDERRRLMTSPDR